MNSRQMVERPSKFSPGMRVLYKSGYTNDSLISFVPSRLCGKSCSSFMAIAGTEWLIDATNCDASALGDLATMRAVFDRIITESNLHVVGEIHWHQFPSPGGIAGVALLSESHLSCHTYLSSAWRGQSYCCRASRRGRGPNGSANCWGRARRPCELLSAFTPPKLTRRKISPPYGAHAEESFDGGA